MRKKKEPRPLTATERVEEHIRQAIYQGALKSRERIIEEDVAKQLKCSHGTVREAFLRLERDGLLVSVARRGTFIRDISAASIEVIFSMRSKLEALCVRYLRQQMNAEAERSLRSALKKMQAAAAKNDNEAFLDADMHFHQTIWKLSNRATLENTLSNIMNPFIFMLARAYSSQMPIETRYQKHVKYLETILTQPISDVEDSVELYFRELATALLSKLPPRF